MTSDLGFPSPGQGINELLNDNLGGQTLLSSAFHNNSLQQICSDITQGDICLQVNGAALEALGI